MAHVYCALKGGDQKCSLDVPLSSCFLLFQFSRVNFVVSTYGTNKFEKVIYSVIIIHIIKYLCRYFSVISVYQSGSDYIV